MKKNFLALAAGVILAACLTVNANAQSKTANIENLSAINKTQVHDKKGRLLYSVYRYDATQLAKDVKTLVLREYYDYEIAGIEEVQVAQLDRSIYFVHLQNDDKLKTVRIYNGETELVKDYRRQYFSWDRPY